MKLKTAISVVIVAVLTYMVLGWCWDETFDPESLKDKNVLITGASSGIGEQMAYWYARYGANVFITARREALLKKVIDKCKTLGPSTSRYGFLAADMSADDDREKVVKSALEFLGDIDHLILNHALMPAVQIWDGSVKQIDELKRIVNVNFVAFTHLTGLALPSLKQTEGCISVVSSVLGRVPMPYVLDYTSSKFAMDGFFSGLRHELKARRVNVSVSVGTIGLVRTDTSDEGLKNFLRIMKNPEKLLVNKFTPPDASEGAHAIIKATAERRGDYYYPHPKMLWLQVLVRTLAPEFMEDWFGIMDAKQTG